MLLIVQEQDWEENLPSDTIWGLAVRGRDEKDGKTPDMLRRWN